MGDGIEDFRRKSGGIQEISWLSVCKAGMACGALGQQRRGKK
jgi:hypothetical protein